MLIAVVSAAYNLPIFSHPHGVSRQEVPLMYYQIVGTNVRLAGSLHMVPAEQGVLPSWVSEGYEWCEQLAMEHDTQSLDWQWVKSLPAGETLEQKMTPGLWQQLTAAWPVNHPLGMLRNQRLWLVLITLPFLNMRLVGGVEPALTARARADGKHVYYLETASEFEALANSVDDARYLRLIEQTLNALPQSEQIVREVHSAWMLDRVNTLTELLPRTLLAQDPVIKEAAMDKRNQAWMPTILEALPLNRRIVIVVGAFHLVGPGGLLALLKGNGFECSPVVGRSI